MTKRQMDFTELAMAVDALDRNRQALVMDLVHRRIDMDEYNACYYAMDRDVDAIHFGYIAKYRIVEQVPDQTRATVFEVLNSNRTN